MLESKSLADVSLSIDSKDFEQSCLWELQPRHWEKI